MKSFNEEFSLPQTLLEICEKGEKGRSGRLCCQIEEDIEFDTRALETYCFSNWEPIIYDAVLLAAAIDLADRITRRPAFGWGRRFDLQIPVHDRDRWSGNTTVLLNDALSYLTGDRWNVGFKSRKHPALVPPQTNLCIPDAESSILPFSDGLDSRIVSTLLEQKEGRKVIRVRLGPDSDRKRVPQAFAAIPYKVKSGKFRFVESSCRSRGFKFALMGGIAAYLVKASEILVPESGQGAIGPALVAVGQAYEDYRNHPTFTKKMELFLGEIFKHKVRFAFPRIWQTKGETLREFVHYTSAPWRDTRSCWQQSRQAAVDGRRRQCGVCAACMLRRMSVHAAGQTESRTTYVWEDLSASEFKNGAALGFNAITSALRQYAIAGTLHLRHLSELSASGDQESTRRRHAKSIAPLLGISHEVAVEKMSRLLDQHAQEWKGFTQSLGEESFIVQWS